MSIPMLYFSLLSPPSRFAWLTAKHIGVNVELRVMDQDPTIIFK